MNIGILTFYFDNDNFGGQLQARALVKAIEYNTDYRAEQIQYDNKKSWNKMPYKKRVLLSLCQAFSSGIGNGIDFVCGRFKAEKKIKENNGLKDTLKSELNKRKEAFHRFYNDTQHSEKVYDNDSITDCLPQYDCFICGGDQIWNDWSDWFLYNSLGTFCLEFVPQSITKLSYAPSVPIQKVRPVFIRRLSNYLKKFDAISVREKSSVHLLEEKIEKPVTVVVDPVLLLTKEQWDKEKQDSHIQGKYVFCYLLGEGNESRNAVEKLARELDCKLVTVPHIIEVNEWDVNFGDIQNYDAGPAEFIDLIKNAEIVVTDSFHATVFSMIYHKLFYVLERTTQISGGSMGSRLTDFLHEYKLESQMVTVEQLTEVHHVSEINFENADVILERRREESYEYLKKNIKKK